MRKATDIPEATVSETGAVIPADTPRAVGIHPGDRVSFVRTMRGSLLVVPAVFDPEGPWLQSVVGISPRPAGLSPRDDQTFLRKIRTDDEDL